MSTAIEIPCPNCEKPLKVPESVFGKKIKCKHCGEAFVAEPPAAPKPAKGAKPKTEEPKKPAPYKFQDDDDDSAKPNPLALIAEADVPRCPFCAKELEPPDARVCIHCGFNTLTRTQAESKKVWAPDGMDWFNHLGPGVAALAICIALITLDIVCIVHMRDWLTGTFLEKDDPGADGQKAFFVRPSAFTTLIMAATVMPIIGTGRFAIRRLVINNQPEEKVKK